MEPTYAKPIYCSACGAPLSGGAFCSQCGAKVIATAVHMPAPADEVLPAEAPTPVEEPVPVAEPAPVTEPIPVVEPVPVTEPAPVAEPVPAESLATPWKFPLASVILLGIVLLMNLSSMFSTLTFRLDTITFDSLSFSLLCDLFADLIQGLLPVCFVGMLMVGMIVCRRQRNLFVAITFLMMSPILFINTVISVIENLSWGMEPIDLVLFFAPAVLSCLYYVVFGMTYLIAKPWCTIVKAAACTVFLALDFLLILITLITYQGYGAVGVITNFLLYTASFYVAVFLFTPFQRK